MSPRLLRGLLVLLCNPPVLACADAVVTRLGHDAYTVRMETQVAAPVSHVRALLTDYEHLGRVNPAIRESRILASRGSVLRRVRTITRSCVSFLCLDMIQVQDVEELPNGSILATIVPGQSDFRDGTALWRILPNGTGTRVIFEARMRPAFWVPPLIGTWMIERQLNRQLEITARNLDSPGQEIALR